MASVGALLGEFLGVMEDVQTWASGTWCRYRRGNLAREFSLVGAVDVLCVLDAGITGGLSAADAARVRDFIRRARWHMVKYRRALSFGTWTRQ